LHFLLGVQSPGDPRTAPLVSITDLSAGSLVCVPLKTGLEELVYTVNASLEQFDAILRVMQYIFPAHVIHFNSTFTF